MRVPERLALVLLLASMAAQADWQPGLKAGYFSSGSMNTNTANPFNDGARTNIHAAESQAAPPWADSREWVYTGQIFLSNGVNYHFAENIDDDVWLKIGGVIRLSDTTWDNPTKSGPVTGNGWTDFELRMRNGGGGAGPVSGNNWNATKGFGYNAGGSDTTDGNDYSLLLDNGTQNLLRHSDGLAALQDFAHSTAISITGYDKLETLTNFPLLVRLSASIAGFDYSQLASSNGFDLIFVDGADGQTNRLKHQIEQWNPTGESLVWVRVPAVSANTNIYMYWGATNVTAAPAFTTDGSTWKGAYTRVFHLGENASYDGYPFLESVNASADAHCYISTRAASNTVLAKGQWYDGDDTIDGGVAWEGTNTYTVSMWVKPTQGVGSWNDGNWALYPRHAGDYDAGLGIRPGTNGVIVQEHGSDWNPIQINWSASLPDWYLVSVQVESKLAKLFVNGELKGTGAASGRNNLYVDDWQIGGLDLGRYDGFLDEFRISTFKESSNWIWACYNSQKADATFITFSAGAVPDLRLIPGADQGGVTNSYYIGKKEVTVSDYVDFLNGLASNDFTVTAGQVLLGSGGEALCLTTNGESRAFIGYDAGAALGARFSIVGVASNHPVTYVSWFGAAAYCNHLSENESLSPVYSTNGWTASPTNGGYRLPSETQWYKAAAWDVAAGVYRTYGNGTDALTGSDANFLNSGDGYGTNAIGTTPVGSYSAVSKYYLKDVSGNVWEWCHDLYEGTNVTMNAHAARGGSWGNLSTDVSTGSRIGFKPGMTLNSVGFRVAK